MRKNLIENQEDILNILENYNKIVEYICDYCGFTEESNYEFEGIGKVDTSVGKSTSGTITILYKDTRIGKNEIKTKLIRATDLYYYIQAHEN